jgi:hypothetical protein
MVRIAISQAAFAAIARTAPFGSVSFENKTNEHGERLIWLDPRGGRPAPVHTRSGRELPRRSSASRGGLTESARPVSPRPLPMRSKR